MAQSADTIALFDGSIIARAAGDAFRKLNPLKLVRNPVIFVTEVVSILVTVLAVRNLLTHAPAGFPVAIALWLWLTVLFATFAEAERHRNHADDHRKRRHHDGTEARAAGLDGSQDGVVMFFVA